MNGEEAAGGPGLTDAETLVQGAIDEIDDVAYAACVLVNRWSKERRWLERIELAALIEECQQTKLAVVEQLLTFDRAN